LAIRRISARIARSARGEAMELETVKEARPMALRSRRQARALRTTRTSVIGVGSYMRRAMDAIGRLRFLLLNTIERVLRMSFETWEAFVERMLSLWGCHTS
jgi:hypothetical protein